MSTDPPQDDAEATMNRAQPAIDSVLRRYRRRGALDHDDEEEIASEARVAILTRLRRAGAAVIDAPGYAARMTRNLVISLFRRREAEALEPFPEDGLADPRPLGQLAVEQRRDLEWLWRKIECLPQEHRAALLLGMRSPDGSDSTGLLIFLDVASMETLAAAIGVTSTELEERLSDELPLDDVRIGKRLGVKSEKVSSLRFSARRHLYRSFDRETKTGSHHD